jgi:hypothetical protein
VTGVDPSLRASDADRESVAAQLRAAREDGRLDTEELEERLGKAYSAKTFGDLAPLTADLAPAPSSTPSPPPAAPAAVVDQPEGANWRLRWASWAGTSVLLVGIWAITCIASGKLLFFWPIFPIGFWALGNVAGMFSNWGQPQRPPEPPKPPEPPRVP